MVVMLKVLIILYSFTQNFYKSIITNWKGEEYNKLLIKSQLL